MEKDSIPNEHRTEFLCDFIERVRHVKEYPQESQVEWRVTTTILRRKETLNCAVNKMLASRDIEELRSTIRS